MICSFISWTYNYWTSSMFQALFYTYLAWIGEQSPYSHGIYVLTIKITSPVNFTETYSHLQIKIYLIVLRVVMLNCFKCRAQKHHRI